MSWFQSPWSSESLGESSKAEVSMQHPGTQKFLTERTYYSKLPVLSCPAKFGDPWPWVCQFCQNVYILWCLSQRPVKMLKICLTEARDWLISDGTCCLSQTLIWKELKSICL
ncbi:rCG57764, partial [Rattus norvegicus]